MSEVIEQESTELVTLPPKESALQVYSTVGGLEPYLQRIKAEIDVFVPDTSTAKGRAAIASMAFKVAKIKTAIEGLGKTVSAELKEIPKKVDAERKRTREKLELWQTEVRKPLTDWEEAEEARVAEHKANLDCLRAAPADGMSAKDIAMLITCLQSNVIDESWEEFETEAHRVMTGSLAYYQDALARQEKYEDEQAELAKLRAEAAERERKDRKAQIAREAEERIRKEAEAKAHAERDAAAKREADAKAAAEKRELELRLQTERAERERLEAIQRAEKEKADAIARAEQEKRDAEERQRQAVEAERKRQADESARLAAEARKREADKAHKGRINRAALEAFIAGGMPEECAKLAVTLIAKKAIPAIVINY